MEAKELRVGNIVANINCDQVEVYSVGRYGINLFADDDGSMLRYGGPSPVLDMEYHFSSLTGIPLTEDWLVRFGFENNRISINSADELCYDVFNDSLRYQTKGSGFTRDFNVKYIHQLQNLYFALTGKYMEVKNEI